MKLYYIPNGMLHAKKGMSPLCRLKHYLSHGLPDRCSDLRQDISALRICGRGTIAEELRRHRDNLEELIGQRTSELRKLNEELETELIERKAVEGRLRSSKQQLRNLSAHLHAVREEERRNIAREINDELGQALTALKMDISWLGNKYRGHEPLSKKTKSMVKLVDATIRTAKKSLPS